MLMHMKELVQEFPAQLIEATSIVRGATIQPATRPIHKILVVGMGGSGIGANFVQQLIRRESRLALEVCKTYTMPAYADEFTLAICSSYSGNTEETLAAYDQLKASGAKLVVISSGGALIERAKANGHDYVLLPDGKPAPRACLGYSIVAQLGVLEKLGIITPRLLQEVHDVAAFLEQGQDAIQMAAERIAFVLQDKRPVIYCADQLEPLAVRFRQQINENAKMLAHHHVIPEMNHNELVGWRANDPSLGVLFFRTADDHPRTQVRMDITKEIIEHYTQTLIEIRAKGNTAVERLFYLIHLVDWISVFLAELRGVDVMEVKVIDFLKAELAKLKKQG
jgi:glucose/mannose-6-phosphate isomerase